MLHFRKGEVIRFGKPSICIDIGTNPVRGIGAILCTQPGVVLGVVPPSGITALAAAVFGVGRL